MAVAIAPWVQFQLRVPIPEFSSAVGRGVRPFEELYPSFQDKGETTLVEIRKMVSSHVGWGKQDLEPLAEIANPVIRVALEERPPRLPPRRRPSPP